jgi:hypothetical protein
VAAPPPHQYGYAQPAVYQARGQDDAEQEDRYVIQWTSTISWI